MDKPYSVLMLSLGPICDQHTWYMYFHKQCQWEPCSSSSLVIDSVILWLWGCCLIADLGASPKHSLYLLMWAMKWKLGKAVIVMETEMKAAYQHIAL